MKSREFTAPQHEIVVIVHNIRSIMNVGSILRSCEGFGVRKVFATGYTPNFDNGLPHVRAKLRREIHKTALGAEEIIAFTPAANVLELIEELRTDSFRILGLEQDVCAIPLQDYHPVQKNSGEKIALLLGEEVHGLTPELRAACDALVEIPMFGTKESFNVAVAAGITLYQLKCNYFTATQSAP